MALRARLAAPPPPQQTWPWHKVRSASLSVSAFTGGDRRLEAETYLSSGFGIRTAIESKAGRWTRFHKLAKAWMPNRLKGIIVSSNYGKPFLAATQVFDVRPFSRKHLAVELMSGAKNCFVDDGIILVTRSGSVGQATMSHAVHRGIVISDDLLRVTPIEPEQAGWVYAFLHTPHSRAMCKGAHYGHMIKHLEPSHLDALPIPIVDDATAKRFTRRVERIMAKRNHGYRLTLEAEACFEKALGPVKVKDWGEKGFAVKAVEALSRGRRRLDATIHNPGVRVLWRHLAKNGQGFTTISDAGYDVWLPSRFRRIPAQDGVLLVDSADLTKVNPDHTKHIADGDFGDRYRARVKSRWVLMARSGQTYGIIGTTVIAERDLENKVISDHVMRIKPRRDADVKPGYLVTALSHPVFGRPLVKSLAYGSSIPEIEVADIKGHQIVRLSGKVETAVAGLAEAAAKARAVADILEREIASEAAAIVDRFIARV